MVKIITLNEISEGEKLKSLVIERFKKMGLVLHEKHEGLCSDSMPKIISLSSLAKDCKLEVTHASNSYVVGFTKCSDSILRVALSFMYGYGHLRNNYDLDIFNGIPKEKARKYMELSLEVWERNIHRDWMKKCGYMMHNGTKDELFLYQMLTDKAKAIKTHRERTDKHDKGDSPHHVFRDAAIIEEIILEEGNHEFAPYLIESFYDEATATTRWWFDKRDKPFEQRLTKNMEEGYFIDRGTKIERWKPGVFGFTNNYETELWGLWVKVHDEFKEYWTNKFGQKEELWQPPVPAQMLKKTTERFK